MRLSRCVGRRRSAWTAASTLTNVTASADMHGLPALGVSKTRKRRMVAPSALAVREHRSRAARPPRQAGGSDGVQATRVITEHDFHLLTGDAR